MKSYFLFFVLIFSFIKIFAQGPTQKLLPSRNALSTTFNLFTDTLSGTCFAITDTTKEYIITAKHLFKRKTKSGDSVLVKINVNNIESLFKAIIFFHTNPLVDIAVLKLPLKVSQTDALPFKDSGHFFGQDCFFLGYPLFNIGTITQNQKIAFIKRAIVSALYKENGINILLLDGHNNPGFSGGPIITYNNKMEDQFIIGIVSGYINQPQDAELKLSKTVSKQKSIRINENSGIIIAYPSEYIKEILAIIH
jgi:S1-C subfamily serine protease